MDLKGDIINMKNMVCVGMCSYDEIIMLDNFPKEDQKYIAQKIVIQCGGMATNVAINLSRIGLKVSLISHIGNDEIGLNILNELKKEDVDIKGLKILDFDTQRTFIFINRRNASRTAIAGPLIRPYEFDDVQINLIKNANLIYIDGSTKPEIVKDLLRDVNKNYCEIFYNLEFYSPLGIDIFQQFTYGIMSEQVINESIKGNSYKDTLKKLWSENNKLIGITFGTNGSIFYDGNNFLKGLVYFTDAIDSTGAGDAFQSGFILGIIMKWDLQFTLDIASVMAGLVCTKIGAHNYPFQLDKIITAAKNLRLFPEKKESKDKYEYKV